MSALKLLTRTIKKLIFACRCWPAFKTNQLFSCWQCLRHRKITKNMHISLIKFFFFSHFVPHRLRWWMQYLFSFKSTVPLRAQLVELKVTLLYLKTKCQSAREKDYVSRNKGFALCKGNLRQSWILDSAPWIPDSRYWIPKFASETRRLFTWREEDPSTKKTLEGGTTLRWVYMQKFWSVWCPNIEGSRGN